MTGGGRNAGAASRWALGSLVLAGVLGAALVVMVVSLGVFGSGGAPEDAEPVPFVVPPGSTFRSVADTLETRDLVASAPLFTLYARLTGSDTEVRAGPYALPPGQPWSEILTHLTEGRVLTETLTIPEGFRLTGMAGRLAEITELDPDTVLARLTADSAHLRWNVPGPGLEGYLFPDTYRLARGAPLSTVLGAMIRRYRAFWTPRRVARRDSLGLSEQEVVTLASIVQAEARVEEEMPVIASVYHNRLEEGQLLQADPTVLYALGGHRDRLLYAAMDSVAENPYNTYTHPGLPPGPIGAPGVEALEATLYPAETDFFYFVAHPDGHHVFSRTLAEHNRAVARLRSEWTRYRRERDRDGEESPVGGGNSGAP